MCHYEYLKIKSIVFPLFLVSTSSWFESELSVEFLFIATWKHKSRQVGTLETTDQPTALPFDLDKAFVDVSPGKLIHPVIKVVSTRRCDARHMMSRDAFWCGNICNVDNLFCQHRLRFRCHIRVSLREIAHPSVKGQWNRHPCAHSGT